jgi:hypothetical protein
MQHFNFVPIVTNSELSVPVNGRDSNLDFNQNNHHNNDFAQSKLRQNKTKQNKTRLELPPRQWQCRSLLNHHPLDRSYDFRCQITDEKHPIKEQRI